MRDKIFRMEKKANGRFLTDLFVCVVVEEVIKCDSTTCQVKAYIVTSVK